MVSLFALLISCWNISLFAAEAPKLTLSPLAIEEFNASLDTAESIIVQDGYSTVDGLSGVFYRMWEDKAERIASEPVVQAYAVKLWNVVQEDPAYQQFASKLTKASRKDLQKALRLGNVMVALSRKDVALALNQDRCLVEFPEGDLNTVLGITFGGKETISRLFKRNEAFPKQDMQIRACSVAQCYALQEIVKQFLPEKEAHVFKTLLNEIHHKEKHN